MRERVVESLRETGDWDVVEVGEEGVKDKEKRADCKANGLFFARGTTEMGLMGNSVGPALSRALGSKWKVDGVSYTADIAGDDCIGFPGGIKCRDQLEKMATACPQTNWFVSGYSQGAMVARICTAFSKEAVKSKIKVSQWLFLLKYFLAFFLFPSPFLVHTLFIAEVSCTLADHHGNRVLLSLGIRLMALLSRVFLRMESRLFVVRVMGSVKGSLRLGLGI